MRHCNTDVVRGELSSTRVIAREAASEDEEGVGKTPDEERVRELDNEMLLDESVEGRTDDEVMLLVDEGRTKRV
jgi:hypothetical protein